MQLGFFTMPIHPSDKDWRQSLREDQRGVPARRRARLQRGLCRRARHRPGREHHLLHACSSPRSPAATKQIRLGTGTVNLPNTHPARVAGAGRDAGPPARRPPQFRHQPRRPALGRRSVRQSRQRPQRDVRRVHRPGARTSGPATPPYDIEGKYWTVTTEKTLIAEIGQGVIAQAAAEAASADRRAPSSRRSRRASTEAAARGWEPISANFLHAAMGGDPLADATSRAASARAARPSPPTGASPRASSSPTTPRPRAATRPTRTAPTVLLQPDADQDEARRPGRAVQEGPRRRRTSR